MLLWFVVADAVYSKGVELRDYGLMKAGVKPEDLSKLSGVPLVCAFVALFVNITLLAAMSNYAWMKATALSAGQPFTAYLSLLSVKFGTPSNPSADNKFFCDGRGDACDLGMLCNAPDDDQAFPNGLLKNTPAEAWCTAAAAGATATSLLWIGFLPGLAAAGFTFLYAARDMPTFASIVLKMEELGFTLKLQKRIIVGCWGVLWAFMFVAMLIYAMMVPDTLGWGLVTLDASFGLLRFAFIVTSIFGARAALLRPSHPCRPPPRAFFAGSPAAEPGRDTRAPQGPSSPPTSSRCGRRRVWWRRGWSLSKPGTRHAIEVGT